MAPYSASSMGNILTAIISVMAMAVVSSEDGILLPPLAGKTGVTKILIYVHGASISETQYVSLSQRIQETSNLNLWVGLPHFLFDTPNPVTINGAVTSMVQRIATQANMTGGADSSDVFVAGHSLGGVFAPAVVDKYSYAGLLEFGSYVTNGLDITSTTFPVLTLGGELDGLTRASRIAVEFAKMLTLPTEQHLQKPVAILPGICHSQFCEGVNVSSFGTHDLVPEVSWDDAHTAIALAASDFLDIIVAVSPDDVKEASARFDDRFAYTNKLVNGLLTARSWEVATGNSQLGSLNWCESAQQQEVAPYASVGGGYGVATKVVSSSTALATTYPSITEGGGNATVTVVSYAEYSLNPIDVSTVPVAAKSLTCEMISADRIAVALAIPGAGGKNITPDLCQAANVQAIAVAKQLVATATRERFEGKGQALQTVADKTVGTGPGFLTSDLSFEVPSNFMSPVSIQSVALATKTDDTIFPGVYQCILLSPSKVVEWMMVDGLPKLP